MHVSETQSTIWSPSNPVSIGLTHKLSGLFTSTHIQALSLSHWPLSHCMWDWIEMKMKSISGLGCSTVKMLIILRTQRFPNLFIDKCFYQQCFQKHIYICQFNNSNTSKQGRCRENIQIKLKVILKEVYFSIHFNRLLKSNKLKQVSQWTVHLVLNVELTWKINTGMNELTKKWL